MNEMSRINAKLRKLCVECNRLSPVAESSEAHGWMDCRALHNMPSPHKIVPITVSMGGGRTAQTYGYWTANPALDKLTDSDIVWYSYGGTACGWVLAWYALPRIGFFGATPQHLLRK